MKFIEFPEVSVKVEGMDGIRIPRMMKIRQMYDASKIEDVRAEVISEMDKLTDRERFVGKRLCITVGSRGIPDLDIIVKAIIDRLLEWGAFPFIVPAMGSHGGGTAEGQKQLIAGYNITEESMGVPILSSMEVVMIGELDDGTPVYCDKYAYDSDGIIVLNKVKPHTDFRGKHESGMAKMMAIGLAKHKGAAMFHMKGFESFADRIPQVCDVFLENAPVAFGVGIVQNEFDKICNIEVMEPSMILERDAALLEIAKSRIAKFKMQSIDVLVIDEIGKNISGMGYDPNIVGRSNSGEGFDDILDLKKLFIRGLSKETKHNACGLNMADITTRRCVNDMDIEGTWTNIYNCNLLHGGRIPMYANNDREALLYAIRTCTGIDYDKVRVVRIRNTLEMEYIEVSESYYDELKGRDDIRILSEPYEMTFDEYGFIADDHDAVQHTS